MTLTVNGLKYTKCHIYCSVLFLLCFYDEVTYYQRFESFFNHPVDSLKNNLRMILGRQQIQ